MSHSVACSDCVRQLQSCSPWETFLKGNEDPRFFALVSALFLRKTKSTDCEQDLVKTGENETFRPFQTVKGR